MSWNKLVFYWEWKWCLFILIGGINNICEGVGDFVVGGFI